MVPAVGSRGRYDWYDRFLCIHTLQILACSVYFVLVIFVSAGGGQGRKGVFLHITFFMESFFLGTGTSLPVMFGVLVCLFVWLVICLVVFTPE